MSDYIDFRGTIAATIERDQAKHPVRITVAVDPAIISMTDTVDYDFSGCILVRVPSDGVRDITGSLTDSQFTALCLALYRAECVRSFTVHTRR